MKGVTTRGFGILEVLISGTMLLIGLTSLASFQSNAQQMVARERNLMIATHVAEQTMERLLVMFPEDPLLADGEHTGQRYDKAGDVVASGGLFATSWQVDAGDPVAGARRVTVTVTWADRGKTRQLVLETVRS
jgi:Tfp pilus assembly protein PilV